MKKNENAALGELKKMRLFIVFANAALLAAIITYGLLTSFEIRDYIGLLTGNVLFVLNFYLLGVTAQSVVRGRNEKKARQLANISYGLRYIGIFATLSGLLILGVISVIPAVIPLFFPRLYYTLYYIFKKGSD